MKGYRCWCGSNKTYQDCHKLIPTGTGLNLHTAFSYPTSFVIRKILDGIKWLLDFVSIWLWLILSFWIQAGIALTYLTLFYDLKSIYLIQYILVIPMLPVISFLALGYISVLLNGTFGRTKEKRVICTCILMLIAAPSLYVVPILRTTYITEEIMLALFALVWITNIILAFNIKGHIGALIYGYAGGIIQVIGLISFINEAYFTPSYLDTIR
ncbi:SEC-C metal-binding domain-containing protein [Motilimonas sp. KMU-193]|uniref:SEC-C metal-binding domain-containing protein n=1 Tax=Motilimonas sp. KMU-193 TaxID=3388668 RepID=UPI00396AF58A